MARKAILGLFPSFFLLLVSHLLIVASELHICQAGDQAFLGTYTKSKELLDGVPVYSNQNDMSFFRNKNFWYLGNLSPWPPETHYRCVEAAGCNVGLDVPPISEEGQWTASKMFGKDPIPLITSEPCVQSSFDHEL